MDNYSEGLATGMALNQGERYPYCGMNNGGWGGFGGEWGGLIGLLIVASLFGGNGWGLGNNRSSNCATQADLASGFSTSEIMSDLNDILLQNSQGFASVQQTLCQGFSGVNATVNTVGNQINQGICNLGYTVQGGFNDISRQISDCCCKLERGIDSVNFNAERNTCDIKSAIFNSTRDIIDSQRCGTDRILNYLTNQEMDRLRSENQGLRFQASQAAQNAYLVDTLRPTARPAYITCSPYESAFGYGRGGYTNGCCGNGNF